jgi:ubiquinone/menaquinone biosynthesis C-methylase UbiE
MTSKAAPVDQAIESYDEQYRQRGLSSQRTYPNESLIQFLAANYFSRPVAKRNLVRVLEVGCGSGANLWMLCKEGFDTYGLDSSREGLELARRHLKDKWGVAANLQVGSFTSLPYEDGFFDIVVDTYSLEVLTLSDSAVALREIARVLKPGGSFFSYRLSDHSTMYAAVSERLDSATVANVPTGFPLANNGPLCFWSPSLARQMYEQGGLRLTSVERVGRTYENAMFVEYLKLVGSRPN